MKPDTERKKRYSAKLHERRKHLHAHVSKDLRKKLKVKRRSLLLHKGDTVRVMRGFSKGKQAKIIRVNYIKRRVYLEGITGKTARGKEVPYAFEPSNMLLLALETSDKRKDILAPAPKPTKPAVQPPKTSVKGETHG